MLKFIQGLFDSNEKQIKKAQVVIDTINSLEPAMQKLTDEQFKQKTEQFKKELAKADGDKEKERAIMRDILPEAFALVREASSRVAGHRHYDVQVMTGYFLFENNVTEVFTGEGKTLAANLPLYLYALAGKGAHLVTVNDYLAKRDAEWNGHIFNLLGLTTAVVNNDDQFIFINDERMAAEKSDSADALISERNKRVEKVGRMKYDHMTGANLLECTKKEAYGADITYGTASEFGFDYLRDNMVLKLEDQVQRDLYYAIVDEADSILIDEARTPLIISQAAAESNELYYKFAQIVKNLEREVDYTVDEKGHTVLLTDEGMPKVDKALGTKNLYSDPLYAYHIDNALKAKELYQLDDEYIIRDGQIMIVDSFTGRVMEGRRYSEGLHQAIEAKENVEVKKESKTVATITLQNYFRLYDFLAGMTGTALTEAEEFANIYSLDVIVIPTNKPIIRKDHVDVVYKSENAKFNAIIEDIKEHYKKEQPVLVGTTSVEKSEHLSNLLNKHSIPHNVLNAKQHEKEAKVVAEAGQKGSITIATNMAGRGTDIALGDGVKELGGLYIIGTERHEARRIDNQLRGRSGRQGDPGESQFYVSFDDDLMRIFGGEGMAGIMNRIGMDENMPVSASLLGKTIETAQKRVESHNFDIRKRLVEYDDVLNQQRNIVYGLRKKLLKLAQSAKKDYGDSIDLIKKIGKSDNLDIPTLINYLDRFNIRDKGSYRNETLEKIIPEFINDPASVLVLKKLIEQIRGLIAVQLTDDMKIDNAESSIIIRQFQSILSEDLCVVVAKSLGYKDELAFYREVDQEDSIEKKSDDLIRFAAFAFLFHYYAVSPNSAREISRVLLVQTIDRFWMDHLSSMADLREGISLRGIANKDPLIEYKNEGFALFDKMLGEIDSTVVNRFMRVRKVTKQQKQEIDKLQEVHKKDVNILGSSTKNQSQTNQTESEAKKPIKVEKVGRNEPCPCGSGKKYKKCCGK